MPFDKARIIRLIIRLGIAFAVWRILLAAGTFGFLSGFIPFSLLIWGVPSCLAIWFFASFSWHRGRFFSLWEGGVAVCGTVLLSLFMQYAVDDPLSHGLFSSESLRQFRALALIGAVDVAVLTACLYVSWQLTGKKLTVRR